VVAGIFGWDRLSNQKTPAAWPPPAVPVTASLVRTADYPVYLSGLGKV
jgi:hypothetical protein